MTWPFENDTSDIEKKLAKRSLHRERQRNLFAIIALVLTAFMITATFSIGFSYFETYQMQQIRLMGTTADVGITNVTENQLVEISKSNLVLDVGIQQRLGSVDTEQLRNARLGVVWINDTEWEHHRLPTISGVVGNYPSSKNEIMLPTWVLEQMGISDPQIGMEIVLSYQIGDSYDYVTDTFLLSGYYTDYIPMRTNNRGYVYVSSAFKDSLNVSLDNSVTAMIRFQGNDNADKNCERLRREIDFTEGQTFEIVPLEQANGGTIILAVIILAVFISFSGYLLIYNILYVSVIKDVQFYGRLKTIGTTQRQIKRIIYKQAIRISCIGIPIGLLLGAVVSFGIVPYFLNMMYSTNSDVGTKVSFSPFIFIGAAIFTFITVMIASMKPAKIAGSVSPIAALQYTAASTKSSARNCSKMKLSRMAWNNVFRNAKSTTLVFASLFFGLSLFLVVTGLLHGLNPENYVSQWGVSDFALTYSIHEREDLISSEMVSEVGQLDGIENLRLTYAPYPQVVADVVYDDAVFHEFLASLDGVNGIDFSDPAKLENYQQNFFSGVFGIDSAYLEEINKTLNLPIDTSAFEQGKVVLLSKTVEDLIQPGQEITIQTQNGQHSFIVANGYLNEGFRAGGGNERGTAPDLYISQTALKELFPQYRVFRVAFDTDGQHDESILQELKQITASQANIDIISRYERREEMQEWDYPSISMFSPDLSSTVKWSSQTMIRSSHRFTRASPKASKRAGGLLDKILQLVDAGNLCVSGGSIDRTFFSLFPEFEDLVGNLVVKVLQEVNQHKLTIQLRLLKIINDTASLNNSSVVSNVYTPTIPHLNTYAASRHSGIPIHHVPIISIIIMVFVLPPLLIMPPPRIIFSTLTGAYRANTMSSVFPSSFTLSSTRYNPVYAPAKRMSKADTATPPNKPAYIIFFDSA